MINLIIILQLGGRHILRGKESEGGRGGWEGRGRGRKPVTFTQAYHVMVRNWPDTSHENVSLDFSYTLC